MARRRGAIVATASLETRPAQAYLGLALLHLPNGFRVWTAESRRGPRRGAERGALQALKLDATLAEAISCLAWVRTFGEWQWEAAEREFRTAVQLNPAVPDVHRLFSFHLSAMGRADEAVVHSTRARDLDPASLQSGYSVAAAY